MQNVLIFHHFYDLNKFIFFLTFRNKIIVEIFVSHKNVKKNTGISEKYLRKNAVVGQDI
jgi:hypothetical protein